MPDLAFGVAAYSRTRGDLPELPLLNLFVESAPASEKGVVLQSRPGLLEDHVTGTGPIRGLYQADGVLSGDVIALSELTVFKGETSLGAIVGTGPVSFAASGTELLLNAGAGIYRTTGSAVSLVTFPDTANVSKLVDLAGYFIAIRKETQQLYYSDVLDGATWDGLSYVSAENEPDPLRDAVVVNDTLALFGSRTVEFWSKTGIADVPFAPIEGRVYQKGVIASGCATRFDNTFAWIGDNGIVYVGSNIPVRISDPGIEERIGQSTTYSLWVLWFEGHEFLIVRLDAHSMAYDAQTKQWCEFASYGRANWRAQCATPDGSLLGDDEGGTIWNLTGGHTDAGGVLERRFRAGRPIQGGAATLDNLRLVVNVGSTPNATGDYSNPVVEMRTSRDAGRTWAEWRATSLGEQGQYRERVEWRRCGMFDDPGILVEFRCADPVPFRIGGVKFNLEPGGRGR